MDKRVSAYSEVRPAKESAAREQRAQQRVTVRQQEVVVQPRVAVREVEDDWFVLLDVAPKKSGTLKSIASTIHEIFSCQWMYSVPVLMFCTFIISTIITGSVFVLVAAREHIQLPAVVSRIPTAVPTTRISISERKPQFEKRILEERGPVARTHVTDDWFVLLDADFKKPGILGDISGLYLTHALFTP